jgi:hypothetical protein
MLSHIFDKPTESNCSHKVSADYSEILLNSPRFCYYGRFFSQSNTRQADYLPCSPICYSKTQPTRFKRTAFSTYYGRRHFDGRCVSHVPIVKHIQIMSHQRIITIHGKLALYGSGKILISASKS